MEASLPVSPERRQAWNFVPSLYFTQGIPYCVVMLLSTLFFKNSGVSNGDIALWTSGFYLPWVLKPLWSPWVDLHGRKRRWIIIMQWMLAASFAALAVAAQLPSFFVPCIVALWVCASLSATHDIAADGFYVLGLSSHQQAYFVGIRSTFFRLSMLFGQGALVVLVGRWEVSWGSVSLAWSALFAVVAGLLLVSALWHGLVLPRPESDVSADRGEGWSEVMGSFFRKEGIGWILLFLLTYRLGEAQLLKMAAPFMLDSPDVGGLALSTEQIGWIYGVVGVGFLVAGGLLGGYLSSRFGLRRMLIPMWLALNVPNVAYLYLSWHPAPSSFTISSLVAVEQFGYGIGFTGYMLTMLWIAGSGQWKVAHYAVTTGFMALGMMLPGMVSGYLQEAMGYSAFFSWVVLCASPAGVAICRLGIPGEFGLRTG